MQTCSITVSGKVQGVFFRQSTKEKARELGITGEVSNLSNGDVMIRATGTKEQLEELAAWCKKGPPRAVVSAVEVSEQELELFDKFRIS